MKKNKTLYSLKKLSLLMFMVLFSSCLLDSSGDRLSGNGVTIGNPVQGFINNPDGSPSRGAMVVYGVARENEIDTVFTSGPNWRVIEVQYKRSLDSVKTEDGGYFITDKLPSADYVVMAHKDNFSVYHRFYHNANDVSELNLQLAESHPISVAMGEIESTNGEYRFIQIQRGESGDLLQSAGLVYPQGSENFMEGAYIKGTNLESIKKGSFREISGAPQAVFDVVVHDMDSNRFEIPFDNQSENCALYVLHEEKLAKWAANSCVTKEPEAEPSLLWSLPPNNAVGAKARIHHKNSPLVTLQFSHPMEKSNSEDFIKVISPDNVEIKNLNWTSYDFVEIELCQIENDKCDTLMNFEVGVDYQLQINKNITSFFGVQKTTTDTLTFTPEPFPRVKTVEGFGRIREASYYDNDVILDEVILDVDIFPSVARAEGNNLLLSTVGKADSESLENGIQCLKEGQAYPCEKSVVEAGISIQFPEELTAPNSYKVVLDSNLSFNNGVLFPKTQTISWSTVFYTRKVGVSN